MVSKDPRYIIKFFLSVDVIDDPSNDLRIVDGVSSIQRESDPTRPGW